MVTLYRYGDVFSFNLIEMHQIVICDLELLREMFSKEVFSARGKPTVFGINLFALLKGGHGGHGLMFNEGIIKRQKHPYYLFICVTMFNEGILGLLFGKSNFTTCLGVP